MPNRLTLLVACLLMPTLAPGQNASLVRDVFTSDSLSIEYPTISPDERWLVFTHYVSHHEIRLMIRPLSGGALRELAITRGVHIRPRFTPAGDRLVFLSSLPRRGPADEHSYLVSAPFDTRSGELTGQPRQISIDAVNLWGGRVVPDVSPDGQWIVYVGNGSNAIKIIPVNGGRAHTLVDPQTFPESITWSADGRFLNYVVANGQAWTRMRVGRDGSAAIVVAQSLDRPGPLSPDSLYSFAIPWGNYWRGSTLRWFASGELLGEIKLPLRSSPIYSAFVGGGRYVIGSGKNTISSMKVVSVAGGPIRQATTGTGSDCKGGWGEDGEYKVCTETPPSSPAVITPAAELKSQIARATDDPSFRRAVGSSEEHVVYMAGDAKTPANWRLMALSLKDGSRTELARNVLGRPCCDPVGVSGMPHDRVRGEFYYRQQNGNRVRLRAVRASGESRLIGDVPADAVDRTIVFQNRIVYLESIRDSVRLQWVPGLRRPARTLATFARVSNPPIEFLLSHDGRQLAVSAGTPQALFIYRFDAEGNVEALPQPISLPFDHWEYTLWLPDGSGLAMIAQPRVAGVSEVAVVKLSDPQHPILLAKDDPVDKWTYSLSPDGKFVAYNSEQPKGGSIFLIDVAQMQKQMLGQMQKQNQKNK